MNKLFSTLCAGVVLATVGTTSVSAIKLKADGAYNNKLYQITVGTATSDSVLYMTNRADGNDSLYVKKLSDVSANEFANTLWCVAVSKSAQQGQSYTFDFLNKATGKKLAIDGDNVLSENWAATTGLPVGTEIDGWAFSMKAGDDDLETGMPLYSYIPGKNKVAALAFNASGVTSDPDVSSIGAGHMTAVEMDAVDASKPAMIANGWIFTVTTPKRLSLDAKALHTILGSRDSALINFDFFKQIANKEEKLDHEKIQNNVFAQGLVAVDDATTGGVFLMKADKSAYLRIDTAYQNASGDDFLTFTDTTKVATFEADKAAQKTGIYTFFFNYAPEGDSLFIKMDTAIYSANIGKGPFDVYRTGNDSTHVVLQDLEANQSWALTVGKDTIRTRIGLGFGTCTSSSSNKTTLDEGLYLIKNKEGKYLAMPIHEDSTYHWVSLEANVEPWDMPSFQWVVEKINKKDASPIKITNREFSAVVADALQLYNDADATIFGEAVAVEAGFVKASKEVMADAHRGYRFLDKDSLKVTSYKLQYWTAFASDDLYMGAMKSGDSVIYVGAKDNYVLAATGAEADFGYKGNVEGLAQLKRQAYTMKSRGSNKMVVEAGENRIAVSDAAAAQVAKFFFKANNNVEGKIYYALIDTAFKQAPDSLRKVGVDENNKYLKRQIMTETRTSAFSVEVDNTPVYRRFDSFKLEGNEGDAADTLRFVEKYRGEFLQMEANEHFMVEGINFLGIDAVNKGEGKSFYVDTAWVERGLGYIKPQYLVSIDRVPAEDVVIRKKCPLCVEMGDAAPDHCIHDEYITEEGFERGKYLVNFVDSASVDNYKWGKYSRVGFVDALHIGDSLYLLLDQFAGLDTKDIDVAAIANADSISKTVSVDRNGNGRYIKNLTGDKHKAYTWSFRFVDLENAAVEEEANRSFLFESLAQNAADYIQPQNASWLKMQNGCLVMSDPNESTFNEIKTGGDDALIFNIEEGEAEDMATDNEVIATSEVTVIAGEGNVTIANAAGKKVVISNILGQTVANTVISSDNAVIAAPQGVVVVAVEGEEAVKAIVK